MSLHRISVFVTILALASTRAADDFPSRSDTPSDCPSASNGCWCHDNFAQCWRSYDRSQMTEEIGQRITKLELLYQPSADAETWIRRMSALREIRISEDGVSLDCSCDLVYAMDDKNVRLVNTDELTFSNCRSHGMPRDRMSARPFLNRCHLLRFQEIETRKRRDAADGKKDDDVNKRASPRKGDKPASHKIKDLAPKLHADHLVAVEGLEQDKHRPASEFVNFISGHRRMRRSAAVANDADDDTERRGRQKRQYGNNMMNNYPMNQPMGGGNYPGPAPPVGGQPQQGYMNAAPGIPGPAAGGGPPEFGQVSDNEIIEMSIDDDYSAGSSLEGDGTISAKMMENIKAVLGATKIDLPVDINDPYDLGLLLRHLRHHSNLLANIGDPEVREQVLNAMQEEEEEEQQDAANGVRENVLTNLNTGHGGFAGGAQGGMHGGVGGGAGGMGAVGGGGATGGAGGMMGHPGMGGQPQGVMGGQAPPYNGGYRQG